MHIIVVGCGRVGVELATTLSQPTSDRPAHSVAVVDKNRRAFFRLEDFAGETVVGRGFDHDTLVAAGVERADALLAVTSGDNSNIVIARVAREHYRIERVVARIQDPARADIYQRLGVPTVASVPWATDQIIRRLSPEKAVGEWADPAGRIRLVELTVGSTWAGRKLDEFEEPGRWRVGSLSRLGISTIAEPATILQSDDVLYVMVSAEAESELAALLAGGAPNDKGAH